MQFPRLFNISSFKEVKVEGLGEWVEVEAGSFPVGV